MGVRRQTVVVAHAIVNGRSLRENEQILALVDDLHRGLDRLDVRSLAVDRKRPQRAEDAAEQAVLEQFLLRHEMQAVVDRQADADEHGVEVARMVRAEQHAVPRQVLQSLHLDAVQQPQYLREHPDDAKKNMVHCSFSRIRASSASLLASKSSAEVSTTIASSAARSGAAARWESL